MKTKLFALLSAGFILVVCCGCFKEETDKVSEINLYVNYETGIMYDLFDDYREHPIECMLVIEEDGNGEWNRMPFGAIEGFSYERGHEYVLRVKRTILANPPQDASNRTYSLIRILSDRFITEPEIPEEKNIVYESDIEYYDDMCPLKKYAVEPLLLVDNDGNFFHHDGSRMPSGESAFIYTYNILDKADPDWVKLQKVPYMWIYSYILSPFTDKVRAVRNATNGLLLKEAITKEEEAYIIENLEVGEELEYAFVVANVYKYGLQRLAFKVRKI